MQKFIKFLAVPTLIYIVQFVLIPMFSKGRIDDLSFQALVVCGVPSVIVSYGFRKITSQFRYCLFTLPMYLGLLLIYHPKLYGIGVINLIGTGSPLFEKNESLFSILLYTLFLFFVEFFVWTTTKPILFLRSLQSRQLEEE